MESALKGLKVVEMGHVIAGPFWRNAWRFWCRGN